MKYFSKDDQFYDQLDQKFSEFKPAKTKMEKEVNLVKIIMKIRRFELLLKTTKK